jgi:hypothetical protein
MQKHYKFVEVLYRLVFTTDFWHVLTRVMFSYVTLSCSSNLVNASETILRSSHCQIAMLGSWASPSELSIVFDPKCPVQLNIVRWYCN